jgi:hypothetical protein
MLDNPESEKSAGTGAAWIKNAVRQIAHSKSRVEATGCAERPAGPALICSQASAGFQKAIDQTKTPPEGGVLIFRNDPDLT